MGAAFIEVIQFSAKLLSKCFLKTFHGFHLKSKANSFDISGLIKRCYQCRSRGELGSCKDPFRFNASHVEAEPGVSTVPCASGWCGKVIEGETGAFREDGEINGIILSL